MRKILRNYFAPCPGPSCFEGRGANIFATRTQNVVKQRNKNANKKIANEPVAKSCAEAAFCKGDPAPRASLSKKLLPAKLKWKVLSSNNNPWKAVGKHVPVARWAQCLKCEALQCSSFSWRKSNFQNFDLIFTCFRCLF